MATFLAPPTTVDGTTLLQSATGVLSVNPTNSVKLFYTRTPLYGVAIGQALVAGNVYFFGLGGGSHTAVAAAAESTGQVRWPKAATIRSLEVRLAANTATGGQVVLRANGADTAATLNPNGAGTGLIAIPGAAGLAVAAGDLLTLKCAPTGGGITIEGIFLEVDA